MQHLFDFFYTNFPPLSLILWLLPLSIVWAFFALFIAGVLKQNYGWKTGYTRKVFHFLIFFSAVFYQDYFGLSGVFILGWAVTFVLIIAIYKGKGHLLYEALAREKDAPHRTKYIIYSYLATFAGGVLSNLLFGKFALFGYAVTGIADAIAEPIGTRWGKHMYKVFSFDKQKLSFRTIEGSLSVFVAAFCILLLLGFNQYSIAHLLFISVIVMLTEAISPSGFDNLLLQVITACLCSVWY